MSDSYDQALRQAMHRLARRAMSRSRIDHKLREDGHEPDVRERVMERLAELDLLDDQAYGRAVVRDLLSRKAAGPRMLRKKLKEKGLDRELTEQLLAEVVEQDDQTARATDLVRRRLQRMNGLDARTRNRRLLGLLARRGFDPDTIENAMEAVRDELPPEPPESDA